MRIDANVKADLDAIKVKFYAERNVRIGTATIALKVDGPESRRLFGDEFTRVAFTGLAYSESANEEESPDGVEWNVKKLVPAFTAEIHKLHLAGHGPWSIQPVLKSITPVKDEAKVVVTIDLPMLLDNKTMAGELVMLCGEVVDVKLESSQMELPIDGTVKPAGVVMTSDGPHGNLQPTVQ